VKTITYSQVWSVELVQAEQEITARWRFNIPEFVWLRGLGYQPQFQQKYNPRREHWVYTAQFQVPDSTVTWMFLRWPDDRHDITERSTRDLSQYTILDCAVHK